MPSNSQAVGRNPCSFFLIKDYFQIFHNEKREGLIRARTIGGKHASASILVYLDAHCEVEPNWLPPLIAPIMKDPKVSTVPMVDSIDGNTYVFEPQQVFTLKDNLKC